MQPEALLPLAEKHLCTPYHTASLTLPSSADPLHAVPALQVAENLPPRPPPTQLNALTTAHLPRCRTPWRRWTLQDAEAAEEVRRLAAWLQALILCRLLTLNQRNDWRVRSQHES